MEGTSQEPCPWDEDINLVVPCSRVYPLGTNSILKVKWIPLYPSFRDTSSQKNDQLLNGRKTQFNSNQLLSERQQAHNTNRIIIDVIKRHGFLTQFVI